MSKDFRFNTIRNDIISVDFYGLEKIKSYPCIIFIHGLKGFKNWGFIPYTAEYLEKNGFFVITFNFSHNGVGENLTEFDELDKFAKNTISLEIEELSQIIDAYSNNFFGFTENKKIFLLGHSRGGAVSLLTAENNQKIKAVAIWASVSTFERYSKRQKKEWIDKGYFEFLNSRTNQLMRMNVSLFEDIEKNKSNKLNIEKAVRNLNKPLFIAHGEQDLSVPVKEAEKLYEWSDKSLTEFYKIAASNHTFGIQHPFTESNPRFDKLLEKTKIFLNQILTEG